jgi:hypothetical protein
MLMMSPLRGFFLWAALNQTLPHAHDVAPSGLFLWAALNQTLPYAHDVAPSGLFFVGGIKKRSVMGAVRSLQNRPDRAAKEKRFVLLPTILSKMGAPRYTHLKRNG